MLDLDFPSVNNGNVPTNIVPVVQFKMANGTKSSRLWTDDLRIPLAQSRDGTFQNHLATAAMLLRKGLSRGLSVGFGDLNFQPDSHKANEHFQTLTQGVFWDGIKRMMNYLASTTAEGSTTQLIDEVLVIVTADIIRGPTYPDQSETGTSDYINNSMLLIGGGLNHTTEATNGSVLPGRLLGYSYGPFLSGRVDYETGSPTKVPALGERPNNSGPVNAVRDSEKIRFANIYESLLQSYGLSSPSADSKSPFRGVKILKTLKDDLPGKPAKKDLL